MMNADLDGATIVMEDAVTRILRKPENKAIRDEYERNEKQVAEILDAMRVAMAETRYERMIAAATVVARGFLPAMFARFAIRQTIERLLQLDVGPVTVTIGPPFFIGQTVRLKRNDLWPYMRTGLRAIVEGYTDEGCVRLDVQGFGPGFVTSVENVEALP